MTARWSLAEEIVIVRRRREGACAKLIAREIDRTPESIGQHVHRMRERGRLAQHRAEELALLERVLAEAS